MATNVSRPIHLQLRPTSGALAPACPPTPKAQVSQGSGDSLPSQILPHLFVGNQEQTNKDIVNELEISYILSLGLLPLISDSTHQPQNSSTSSTTTTTTSTTTTTAVDAAADTTTTATTNITNDNGTMSASTSEKGPQHIVMPSQNSSKDYKIRLGAGTSINESTVKRLRGFDGNNKCAVKAAVRYIQCKCINIADSSEQTNLTKFFDEAHQFIDEARRKKCNILVHCLAGISRSPTIAIAYLMRVNSLRLQDAYNLVKQCRPQIDVNLSFMGQLMIYGKRLLTSCRRPTPRQPADNSHLAINIMNACEKHRVNINQSAEDDADLSEERRSECDLSHMLLICEQ